MDSAGEIFRADFFSAQLGSLEPFDYQSPALPETTTQRVGHPQVFCAAEPEKKLAPQKNRSVRHPAGNSLAFLVSGASPMLL